jgi:hypothetical protein
VTSRGVFDFISDRLLNIEAGSKACSYRLVDAAAVAASAAAATIDSLQSDTILTSGRYYLLVRGQQHYLRPLHFARKDQDTLGCTVIQLVRGEARRCAVRVLINPDYLAVLHAHPAYPSIPIRSHALAIALPTRAYAALPLIGTTPGKRSDPIATRKA